ncbi:MAG TPA: class I SAM-dependent methyltransferase [Nitrospira sp.]|jgi:Methyltransferase domain|nr:class I SAM-dependent methyltransferase [Nitrospira sp.]
MTNEERVRVFDSQGEAYKHAFQIFLEHTDQKRNAKRWLQHVVDTLPARNVFIDAGAGNGEVTRSLAHAFERTIAIEPNLYLLKQLQEAVPVAEAIGEPIMTAQPSAPGDLVLCSHTFYYIPAEEWVPHLERLVSWMSPTGVTVVVLQHRESGCMNMVHHFFGHRFELGRAADLFRLEHGNRYEVVTTLDPAHVVTPDLTTTYAVAEFMLNLLHVKDAPTRRDVEAYVQAQFACADGGYRIPVHQDFLQIRNRAVAALT